jgi:Flp pilus assembly protein TadB
MHGDVFRLLSTKARRQQRRRMKRKKRSRKRRRGFIESSVRFLLFLVLQSRFFHFVDFSCMCRKVVLMYVCVCVCVCVCGKVLALHQVA